MLLQMAVALTIASCAIEWILYYNFPRLVAFTHGKSYRDIVLSLGLSTLMGACFGANGVVIMIAGAASTALSPLGMPVIRWLHSNQENFPEWKATAEVWWTQAIETGHDLAILTYTVLRILTMPVRWATRFINHPQTKKVLAYVNNH